MATFLHHQEVDGLTQRSWSWLLRNIILPTGDLALGHRMIKRLRLLEEAQWWDSDRLNDYRDRSLRSLIQLAYREVPFYCELMRNAGVMPNDVRYSNDLPKLPIVTKEMLRS